MQHHDIEQLVDLAVKRIVCGKAAPQAKKAYNTLISLSLFLFITSSVSYCGYQHVAEPGVAGENRTVDSSAISESN